MVRISGGAVFSSEDQPARFDGARIGSKANFDSSRFAGEATFIGIHIDGQASFHDVQFESKKSVSFDGAEFTSVAYFLGSIFSGEAQFRSHFCHQAAFQGTVFRKRVTFSGARIEHRALFRPEPELKLAAARFEGEVNFADAYFGSSAEFQEASFISTEKPVAFDGAKFCSDALFFDALFAGEATFIGADIGNNADFSKAQFTGIDKKVSFDRANIRGNATYYEVRFAGETSFVDVTIAGQAGFREAQFENKTSFFSAEFHGTTFFQWAKFLEKSKPSFLGTLFAHGVFFQGARFYDEVDFGTAVFQVEARFHGVIFDELARFNATRFTGLAGFHAAENLPGTVFAKVTFDHAVFEGNVRFVGAEFREAVSFQDTSFRVAYFSPLRWVGEEEQFQSTIDLRGCTYERIGWLVSGDPKANDQQSIGVAWETLLDHLEPYDRQPYTQLEKVFRAAGQDRYASQVYLKRQRTESKRLRFRTDPVGWIADRFYRWVLNYGVRPLRLIALAVLCIMLGIGTLSISSAAVGKDEKVRRYEGTQADALALSLNQFLPIEIPMGSQWKASEENVRLSVWIVRKIPLLGQLKASTFATWFLKIPGWILVPLGVAAFSNLLRRPPK